MSSDLNTLSNRTHIRKLMVAHIGQETQRGEIMVAVGVNNYV